MSALSGISGGGQGLYSFFQGLSANNSTQPAGSTSASTSAGPTSPTGTTAATTGTAAAQGHHHHHHGGQDGPGGAEGNGGPGGSKLFQQIQSAVTNALQQAGSNSSSDPNQIIENAIESVFKQNGTLTSPAGSSSSTTGASSTGSTTQSTDTDGSSSTSQTGSGSNAQNAFFSSLQSLGVNPQQFHNDFQAAIQAVQAGGTADPSTVLGSLPPGSIVDTMG